MPVPTGLRHPACTNFISMSSDEFVNKLERPLSKPGSARPRSVIDADPAGPVITSRSHLNRRTYRPRTGATNDGSGTQLIGCPRKIIAISFRAIRAPPTGCDHCPLASIMATPGTSLLFRASPGCDPQTLPLVGTQRLRSLLGNRSIGHLPKIDGPALDRRPICSH